MVKIKYIVGSMFLGLYLLMISCSGNVPDGIQEELALLPDKIDFNFHVRPILSDRCYSCHGPDENARKGELRLDVEEIAFEKLASGNGRAIVKGSPQKSQLIYRILSEDPEVIMPTPESHLTLTSKEKAVLYKWIDQGAEWKEHWAFLPIEKPVVPEIEIAESHNEIDNFIIERIQQDGFRTSPLADKERLIRRVTMDLTGLPPTIEEIDNYLDDEEENAYAKIVDRLLSSASYAERMAMEWLDVSRYADSHGMHADGARRMWPWRDWVIEAFRSNMPYDQFGTWQIAGDLLPNATTEQRLATAFNRNHTMTAEGGAIDEEFRLGYVFDRAETISTAFMGLTAMCAKCHDHKFDPITQKEYYEMTAFFNNVREIGMTGDDGDYGPMLALADAATLQKLENLKKEVLQLEKSSIDQITSEQLTSFIKDSKSNYLPKDHIAYAAFNKGRKRKSSDAKIPWNPGYGDQFNDYIIDDNANITGVGENEFHKGIDGNAIRLHQDYDDILLHKVPTYESYDSWSVAMWVNTEQRDSVKTQTLIGTTGEKNNFWRGWEWYLDGKNRMNVELVHNRPHNLIHTRSKDSIKVGEWTHIAMSYDGSIHTDGIQFYINGQRQEGNTSIYDRHYKSIKPVTTATHKPLHRTARIGRSYRSYTGENGYYKGLLDETYVYNRTLTDVEVASLYNAHGDIPFKIDQAMISGHSKARFLEKSVGAELKQKRKAWLDYYSEIDEIMVMEEQSEIRPTYVYERGAYEHPSYVVHANTPAALPDFPEGEEKNRLGLARWIFSVDHPLTARVTVNRYWQMIWGTGLVNTPGDFGIQGALPSHPELLDWLANDFIDHGWDVKRLMKQMVMSRTYRSSSTVTEENYNKDPDNILLARAPTYRLPAEMIRDNALAASGLLVHNVVGGASVKPYQPEGLWIEKSSFSDQLLRYHANSGDSLYRRSMYTFIRRTQPHPAMTIFDQPNREICTVKRENTNTPLQALVLLNDPQFVEAAKMLAQRMQIEGGTTLEDQIIYAFRLVVGRTPYDKEISLFNELYDDQFRIYNGKKRARKKLLAVGDAIIGNGLSNSKTAALTIIASTMINHDEAYTKR